MSARTVALKLRSKMTLAERRLWSKLRAKQLGVKFRRQEPVGNHVLDFVCFERKIIIEVDGGQHSGNEKDKARDKFFRDQGYNILRFWNNEVMGNMSGVINKIEEAISPSP